MIIFDAIFPAPCSLFPVACSLCYRSFVSQSESEELRLLLKVTE
ncbi:hypothetical protein [Moorena producens]|nr:hypothetical protein [Moorena producens]